jgi:hypothetical protein
MSRYYNMNIILTFLIFRLNFCFLCDKGAKFTQRRGAVISTEILHAFLWQNNILFL